MRCLVQGGVGLLIEKLVAQKTNETGITCCQQKERKNMGTVTEKLVQNVANNRIVADSCKQANKDIYKSKISACYYNLYESRIEDSTSVSQSVQ